MQRRSAPARDPEECPLIRCRRALRNLCRRRDSVAGFPASLDAEGRSERLDSVACRAGGERTNPRAAVGASCGRRRECRIEEVGSGKAAGILPEAAQVSRHGDEDAGRTHAPGRIPHFAHRRRAGAVAGHQAIASAITRLTRRSPSRAAPLRLPIPRPAWPTRNAQHVACSCALHIKCFQSFGTFSFMGVYSTVEVLLSRLSHSKLCLRRAPFNRKTERRLELQ